MAEEAGEDPGRSGVVPERRPGPAVGRRPPSASPRQGRQERRDESAHTKIDVEISERAAAHDLEIHRTAPANTP
jgi:hypothetical protein